MADTFDDLQQQEHERSLLKQKEIIQAYNQDVLGSYERAEKRAYDTALPDESVAGKSIYGNIGKRVDYKWIQKVRGIAESSLAEQQQRERAELIKSYNLKKVPNGPIGSFVDMPVRLIDGLGRDLGVAAGKAKNDFANDSLISSLGASGSLSPKIDRATEFVDSILSDISPQKIITESPWIEKRLRSLKNKANEPVKLKDINTFFDRINNIWSKGLRKMAGEFGEILDEWWHDPRTLCCLIKTLAALALASGKSIKNAAQGKKDDWKKDYNKFIKKSMSGNLNIAELTGTRKFFDKMIAILRVIKKFLEMDLNFNFALNLDLGLSMSKASVGALMALLTALQQMLEDKIYVKLSEFVENNVRSEIRQCLPFERLLRMLADWMAGPDGMFKYIEEMVDSYMIGFQTNTQYGFDQSVKTKLMDVTALNKLITLLEKLRDAMLNAEMCLEADFNKTPELSDDSSGVTENTVGINSGLSNDLKNAASGKKSSIIYPTDREIVAFLTNRLGESQAFADQVIASAKAGSDVNVGMASGSPDNAGGDPTASLRMAIGDCARTLNSQRIEELANLVADWEIV